MIPVCRLVIIAAFFIAQNCDAQILFSNSDLQIYASKNITAFHFNEAYLDKFLNHLSESVNGHSLENFEKAVKFTYPNVSQTKLNAIKKARLSNLKMIKSCKRDISEKKTKATEIFRMATHQNDHSISKRGISFLGEALSAITNNPSPAQWSEEKRIVKKIAKITEGEIVEINQIKKAFHEQNLINTNLMPSVNQLGKQIARAETEFNILSLIFENFLEIEQTCNAGKKLSENLLNEALEIESIFENSLKNHPDKSLFPHEKIFEFISKHNKNIKVPAFQNNLEISKLYQMSSAVTVIDKNVIHSIISLPLVDFTLQYSFFNYPILSENEIETINKLSKIALRPIDMFLCCETLRRIRLFSSTDLERCAGTADGKSHICKGRTLLFPMNGKNPCLDFHIPNTIAVELSPTLILIKSDQKKFTLECGNSTHAVLLNSTFATVHIPRHCELHGLNTFVGRYDESVNEKINYEFTVMTADYPNLSKYANYFSNMTHFTIDNHIKQINEIMENVTNINGKNDISFGEIYEKINMNTTHGIALTIVIAFLKISIVVWIVWKCYKKVNSKKGPGPINLISQV